MEETSLESHPNPEEFNKQSERIVHKTSHGSILDIQFEYPEENPENFVTDITDALTYAGIFDGVTALNKD